MSTPDQTIILLAEAVKKRERFNDLIHRLWLRGLDGITNIELRHIFELSGDTTIAEALDKATDEDLAAIAKIQLGVKS